MSVREGASAPLNPANLWGKPDPRVSRVKEEEVSRKIEDEHLEDEDIDVESALDEADVEEEVVHAEVDAEVGDDGDDDDDSEFEPEEGDEEEDAAGDADDELEDDTTASASDEVEDETPAAAAKATATSRKRDMSAKKTSLSDHIRSEIARRQEAGEELRGKDIVAALASRRIKVSPAQVSQILKKEGLSSGTRGRKPKAAVAAGDGDRSRTALKTKRQEPKKMTGIARIAPKVAKPATNGFHVPMEQLQAAETFVAACGGSFQSAERILTAAAQLSATFSG